MSNSKLNILFLLQFTHGTTSVKKEGVAFHAKSAQHKESLAIKSADDKRKRCEPQPLEESLMKMDDSTMTKMDKLFRTAYYLALSERPFTDFPKLIELQTLNGISLGQTYCNDKSAREFISQIAGHLSDDLKSSLLYPKFMVRKCV